MPFWTPLVAPVAKLADTVLSRVLPNKTEQEKLSHEQRKQRLDAEKRKDATPQRDPSDTLGDDSF